jgi:hypothetical protein
VAENRKVLETVLLSILILLRWLSSSEVSDQKKYGYIGHISQVSGKNNIWSKLGKHFLKLYYQMTNSNYMKYFKILKLYYQMTNSNCMKYFKILKLYYQMTNSNYMKYFKILKLYYQMTNSNYMKYFKILKLYYQMTNSNYMKYFKILKLYYQMTNSNYMKYFKILSPTCLQQKDVYEVIVSRHSWLKCCKSSFIFTDKMIIWVVKQHFTEPLLMWALHWN